MSVTLAEGTLFAGRYRIVRPIASGGMGAVYEAVHVETQRRRALKVMHPHLFQSAEMRERFKQEARIAAHVESEHIVDVFDAGVDEATQMPFLVMELLRGEELSKRQRRTGRIPPDEVITYLSQAALALDKTHESAIVHRDLKPDNLFVTRREDGSPHIKILDFGIAKLVREGTHGSTQSMGTPLYMAPEQYRAGQRLGPAADLYALGMMAYTLLVGEPYWKRDLKGAGDIIAFALLAVQGPPEPASRRAAPRGVTLPPAFDAWFARATAVEPARRFARASEAVQALAEALRAGVGVAAPPPHAAAPAGLDLEALATSGSARLPLVTADLSGSVVQGAATRPPTPFKTGHTATNAALTVAPRTGGRAPLLLSALALGVAAGAGLWLVTRPDGPAPPPAVAHAAEAAGTGSGSPAPPQPSVAPVVPGVSASAEAPPPGAAPATSSALVAPGAALVAPSAASARSSALEAPKPVKPRAPARPARPLPLIGRD